MGGHRGIESRVVPASGIRFRRLLVRSLRSVDVDMHVILDPMRLALSIPQAFVMLAARRPAAVFTTGGYVALPALIAAAVLRIPVVMWDGNVVPGRSVRWAARLVDCLAVSFPQTAARLGGKRPAYVTGTPIRDASSSNRLEAREALGIPGDVGLILVFGGSQAVRRFNTAVAEALPRLAERAYVIHVTGDDGYEGAVAGREALPGRLRGRYRPERFLDAEMTTALAAADLVVGRAGSSTLAEVAVFGLPMIVVPYPHAAGHQSANAEAMVSAGAARFVEDSDFDADALLGAAALLDRPAELGAMAAAARSLARPGAAAAVAELVLAEARRQPLPSKGEVESIARGIAQ
jgi:UDP-N-acetylglucosamine--N-acetylmuramyl-(pentapeptide) pyrophosphoryl-undecaprenol N-acetylglucosamine transferase